MALDGGRNAALGLRYQYLRTLEALMDAVVDPSQTAAAAAGYRNAARTGLGDESAGLLIGYLISEIFRRAAAPADAMVEVSYFKSVVLVDGAVLSRALGQT